LKLLRPLDWVIIGVAISGLILLGWYSYGSGGTGSIVEVRSDDGVAAYPLSEDRELFLTGPIGETHISIENSTVRVLADPGPLQICVNAGAIERHGEWLACLPNKILITIQGAIEGDIDIISR